MQSNPDALTLAPFAADTDDSGELWANDTDGETRARTEPDNARQCLGPVQIRCIDPVNRT